eukprot:TRINITY_DN3108_c0_g1_i2.p1 TRINITY_DN3108_c0_g1~~TRINITY_DN3108_c0_g1_i2.p1  ORF type:complete len:112 (+),score=34.14 TRINITY_DN3108_c0_g1_i2:29-364(+)
MQKALKKRKKMGLEEKRSATMPRKARRLQPEQIKKEVKKEEEKDKVEENSEDEEDYPEVQLSELLSEMKITDPTESKPEVVIIEKKSLQEFQGKVLFCGIMTLIPLQIHYF